MGTCLGFFFQLLLGPSGHHLSVVPTAVRDLSTYASLPLFPVVFWEQGIQFNVLCFVVLSVPLGPVSEPSNLTLLISCHPPASFLTSHLPAGDV